MPVNTRCSVYVVYLQTMVESSIKDFRTYGGGGVVSQKQKQIAADRWERRLSQMWMSIEIKLIFIFYYLEILSVQCKFKFNI